MILARGLTVLVFLYSSAGFAKDRLGPCHTRSRQMTLVKNCYTGDMMRPLEGGAQFFESAPINKAGVGYCYNSLILIEQSSRESTIRIHVLKDSKDAQVHGYDYALPAEDIKKLKKDAPLISLKGLKGQCFSPSGDRTLCDGGILKTIGLKDTDLPMVVAVGRAVSGHYTVSHLVYEPSEIGSHKPRELEPAGPADVNVITQKLIQEIRQKLVSSARYKMAQLHSSAMTPKKLSDASEQFRYCALALDSFLKEKKLPDPLLPEEKMTLAKLTSYMNNEQPPPTVSTRLPASSHR